MGAIKIILLINLKSIMMLALTIQIPQMGLAHKESGTMTELK